MHSASSLIFVLVTVLAGTSAGQESSTGAKQAAVLPHMDDVKTAPVVYTQEPYLLPEQVRSVTLAPLPSDRGQRKPAAKLAHHELLYPLFDVADDGTHWVRGATYKASFGTVISGGMSSGGTAATYVPFLGAQAPRNWPITMRITSITVGGTAVGFDTAAPAVRDGTTIAFDRGTVVEQYLIGREGMEQRFVFDSLPSRGEIVVTLGIETELVGRAVAEGLRFENELGHALYGKAFALDATGRTSPMEERLENGRIQLVVPADVVATAQLPLVIDPFVSTMYISTVDPADLNADVAVVTGADSMLVVFEREFSATDHDAFAMRFLNEVFDSIYAFDVSSTDVRNPRVAANELDDMFLCVYDVKLSNNRAIYGKTIPATAYTISSSLMISLGEAGDKHDPDVGGDPFGGEPTYFLVVWQRDLSAADTDIHARLVTSTGTPTGSIILVENSGATLDSRPSISKTNGMGPFTSQDWTIAWTHQVTPTNNDVQGARIHWSGTITSPTFNIATSGANELLPTVSEPLDGVGLPRQWMAVYTVGADLRFRVFEGTSLVDSLDLVAGSFQAYGAPDVSIDGRLWQVAFTQRQNTVPFADTDVRAATLNCVGGVLEFSEMPTPIGDSPSENEVRPRIASTMADHTNPYRSYIVYDVDDDTFDLDVYLGIYDSPVNAGGFTYCFGTAAACPCGNAGGAVAGCANSVNANGAELMPTGVWAVTDDSARLRTSGMPATASALYFQGTGQILNGAAFGDGLRCANGTIVRLATKTAVGGISHFPDPGDVPLHVKGGVPAAGGWRYYQSWYRNVAAFCTASNFNLSNGVALLWAP